MDDIEAFVTLEGITDNLPSLLLEGNSLFVIKGIGSRELYYFSRQENIIFEIQIILSSFVEYDHVLHVRRQGNEIAHLLVRHARLVDDTV